MPRTRLPYRNFPTETPESSSPESVGKAGINSSSLQRVMVDGHRSWSLVTAVYELCMPSSAVFQFSAVIIDISRHC